MYLFHHQLSNLLDPPGNSPLDVPITHPTPIQPHYNTEQQIPFSTFWNLFTFEIPQQHPPHPALQDIWSNNYIQPVSNMQQTLSTSPFLNTTYWLNITQSHVQANINTPAFTVAQTQPKEMGTQITVSITPEQQLEID